MGKKNKFDLTTLVKEGYINVNDKLTYAADPNLYATVVRHPGGDFKLFVDETYYTCHTLVVKWMGMEPTNAAINWLKTPDGRQLNEVWEDCLEGVAPMKKAA